jgi:hypothetical protein
MAANVNTNVYSTMVNNNSRIIDEQQVILENYIKQIQTNLLSNSSIELNDIDNFYDKLEKKREEIRELKKIIDNIKEETNKINNLKNEINELVDEKLIVLNKNKFDFGLQGIVKTKLRQMPNNNFTEEQKNLINATYKRIGGKIKNKK